MTWCICRVRRVLLIDTWREQEILAMSDGVQFRMEKLQWKDAHGSMRGRVGLELAHTADHIISQCYAHLEARSNRLSHSKGKGGTVCGLLAKQTQHDSDVPWNLTGHSLQDASTYLMVKCSTWHHLLPHEIDHL